MDFNIILDILKVGVGLTYLYLEYKAMRQMWIASVIMPMIGMVLFFNKGLYADCAINVYYLLIAVYGWWVWSRKASEGGTPSCPPNEASEGGAPSCPPNEASEGGAPSCPRAPSTPRHTPWLAAVVLVPVWLAAWALIWWVLTRYTDSQVPVLDSFTTSLSIVGMWMLARKYAEQWMVWMVVDGVYVWLYYIKGIYFSGTLYAFYTIMTIPGYLKWIRMMKQPTPHACDSRKRVHSSKVANV